MACTSRSSSSPLPPPPGCRHRGRGSPRPAPPRRSAPRRRAPACASATTTLRDLLLLHPAALDALGDDEAAVQQQHVALAHQALGAALVEDDLGVGGRRHREGEAGRDVGLDHAGDDVDRRALRGDDQVDADGTGLRGDAVDRLLDVAGRDHHQVGQLVDHDEDERQARGTRGPRRAGHCSSPRSNAAL